MTTYLIKRVFLMIITLFGICLVSFAVINLAPGDPADKTAAPGAGGGTENQGISELIIRKNRERMFLDKPILFNPSPSDRYSVAALMMEDLLSEDENKIKDVEGGRLVDLGTMALPPLIDDGLLRLDLNEGQRKTLLKALTRATIKWDLDKNKDKRLIGKPEARAKAWVDFWKAKKSDFEPSKSTAAVSDLLTEWDKFSSSQGKTLEAAGKDPVLAFASSPTKSIKAAVKKLIYVGQFAVPNLMAIYRASTGKRQQFAAWALCEIVGKTWDLTISANEHRGFESEWERDVDTALKTLTNSMNSHKMTGLTEPGLAKNRSKAQIDETLNKIAKEAAEKGDEGKPVVRSAKIAFSTIKRLGTRKSYDDLMTGRAFEDHRRGWRNWWERKQEFYLSFSGPVRGLRMFTDTRFGYWLGKLLRLDFGESYTTNRPVMEMIKERFWVTFKMNFSSLFLTYFIAIPIGIFSATSQYSLGDRITTVVLFVLYSLPTFWVGTMMIWLLTGPPYLDWFPSAHQVSLEHATMTNWEQFWDSIWHLTLPVICLTYGGVAYISRQMRAGMLETVRQDFIRTARAKGLSEPVVILKHALRNSLIPIVTLLANLLPLMIGGSVIIEQIFSIEGLGRLSFEAVLNRDYPVIMTIFTLSGFLTLMGILASDIMYAFVDPRIKYQ